jgi:hypothetical protein
MKTPGPFSFIYQPAIGANSSGIGGWISSGLEFCKVGAGMASGVGT